MNSIYISPSWVVFSSLSKWKGPEWCGLCLWLCRVCGSSGEWRHRDEHRGAVGPEGGWAKWGGAWRQGPGASDPSSNGGDGSGNDGGGRGIASAQGSTYTTRRPQEGTRQCCVHRTCRSVHTERINMSPQSKVYSIAVKQTGAQTPIWAFCARLFAANLPVACSCAPDSTINWPVPEVPCWRCWVCFLFQSSFIEVGLPRKAFIQE